MFICICEAYVSKMKRSNDKRTAKHDKAFSSLIQWHGTNNLKTRSYFVGLGNSLGCDDSLFPALLFRVVQSTNNSFQLTPNMLMKAVYKMHGVRFNYDLCCNPFEIDAIKHFATHQIRKLWHVYY